MVTQFTKLSSNLRAALAASAFLVVGCTGAEGPEAEGGDPDTSVVEGSLTGDDLTALLFTADFAASPAPFHVISGGSWAVTGGRYVVSSPAGDLDANSNLAMHDTSVAGDFRLEVTGRTVGTSSVWNDFSVVFTYIDAQN